MIYKLVKDHGVMENVKLVTTNEKGVSRIIVLGKVNTNWRLRAQINALLTLDMYEAWDVLLTEEDARVLTNFAYFGVSSVKEKENIKKEVKDEPKSFWEIMTQRG